MTCPICDQKPANCDCSAVERTQFEELEELQSRLDAIKTTDAEKAIVMKTAEAWGLFLKLDDIGTDATREFLEGINRCQDVIRGRLAKRADPEFWH